MERVALKKKMWLIFFFMQAGYQGNPLGAESYRERVRGIRWDGKGAIDGY